MDFFEPRVPGRFYETGEAWDLYLMYSTDYRKRLYVDGNIRYKSITDLYRQDEYTAEIRPTFSASDRLSHLNRNYLDNLRDVLGQPQINTFSLRILYYIDYQSLQLRL